MIHFLIKNRKINPRFCSFSHPEGHCKLWIFPEKVSVMAEINALLSALTWITWPLLYFMLLNSFHLWSKFMLPQITRWLAERVCKVVVGSAGCSPHTFPTNFWNSSLSCSGNAEEVAKRILFPVYNPYIKDTSIL